METNRNSLADLGPIEGEWYTCVYKEGNIRLLGRICDGLPHYIELSFARPFNVRGTMQFFEAVEITKEKAEIILNKQIADVETTGQIEIEEEMKAEILSEVVSFIKDHLNDMGEDLKKLLHESTKEEGFRIFYLNSLKEFKKKYFN